MNAMFSQIYANAANRVAPIFTGPMTALTILPTADNSSDLGSAALSWRNVWIDGTLTVATIASSGALNLTNKLTITLTTAQLRLAYDGSNYVDATVSSAGLVTFDATGAGAGFQFVEGLKERNRTVAMGEWADHAHAAGDFTAESGNWTVDSGDMTLNRYSLVGKTLTWQFVLTATDVSATPAYLKIALPGSLTASAHTRRGACGLTTDAAAPEESGQWALISGDNFLRLFRSDVDNVWTLTAADNTGIACTVILEIT